MRLPKLANWFSDGDLEKYQQQAQQGQQLQTELQKTKSQLDKLNLDCQKSEKELAQTKAQLQIYQGFQIELGETQIKLQQTEAQVQRYKKELFDQQQSFRERQAQFQEAQQALDKLAKPQDWLNQIRTPIQIVDIKKTLPKQDFETLWGFGIITPTVKSMVTMGALVVKGWVLGKQAVAENVRVSYQTHVLLESPVKLRRPIVVQQYPDIPTANQSGFEFSLAVVGIPNETELCIEAVLADKTIVPLCNFILNNQAIESNDT